MDAIQFEVKAREKFGKEATAKYRNAGGLPANLYGLGENASLLFDHSVFVKSLKGSPRINPLLALTFEGGSQEKCYAVVREVQKHPLSRELLHVDLQRVAEDKKVTVMVNVRYTGVPIGVKADGGVLTIQRKRLKMECLPKDIPEIIEVDIADVGAGEKILVSGVSVGDSVSFMDPPNTTIMNVKKPKGGGMQPAEEDAGAAEVAAEESK